MRWSKKLWSGIAAGAAAVGGLAYAATATVERMPAPTHVETWLTDLEAAAIEIPAGSPAREAIEAGELDAAREMLGFRPRAEAPLPEGFPAFTPVGVIEVKTYPAYRKAVGGSFWPLFNHISKQGIPMTAPVEMSSETGRRGDGEMAFLYQNTSVGDVGPIDGVAVEDTAETVVASLGMRGGFRDGAAQDAKTRLEAWLAGQTQYRRAAKGDAAFRLFGYNSPMVPNSEKYWEAQLLLEPAE
ncbi:MAG: heme-binding protein [Planctomycetota bacterium]